MEKDFLGGWLAGSATAAVVSIIVFVIAYYAKPYIDKKIRATKIARVQNKKSVVKKNGLLKRVWFQISKHTIPIIVLIVVIGILYLIFASFTGSNGDTLAWWIIGITTCILIGIAALKFRGTTSLSGISLPSIKIWKNIGVVAVVIVAGIIVLGWYLNHHHPFSEGDKTTISASFPEIWANDPADFTASDGYLHAGANQLVAGTFYHLNRVSYKDYSFYTHDGVRIVNITADNNDDEFGSYRVDKNGSQLITLDQPLPTHEGLYKVNVDTTAVIYMKVLKK